MCLFTCAYGYHYYCRGVGEVIGREGRRGQGRTARYKLRSVAATVTVSLQREWRWEFREKEVSGWTIYEDQALTTQSEGYTDCRNLYFEFSVLFLIVQKQDFKRIYRCYYIEHGVHFDNISAHYYFRPVSMATGSVYSGQFMMLSGVQLDCRLAHSVTRLKDIAEGMSFWARDTCFCLLY